MKKSWKFLMVTGLAASVLVGCSDDTEVAPGAKEGKQGEVASSQVAPSVDFNKLYEMKDKEVLVEVEGQKLTVGEVKEKLFRQGLVGVVNQFIDSTVLIERYEVTDEDVKKEVEKQKEAMGEYAKGQVIDEEAIRYNLAYEKAIKDGVEYTEEDLKQIYEQYYSQEERSFEEMLDQLKEQAPYVLGGNNVYEKQQALRKKAKIDFKNDSLKAEFDRMANPVVPSELPKETEEKEETKDKE